MAGTTFVSRRLSEFIGVALFALALMWLISLASYSPADPVFSCDGKSLGSWSGGSLLVPKQITARPSTLNLEIKTADGRLLHVARTAPLPFRRVLCIPTGP